MSFDNRPIYSPSRTCCTMGLLIICSIIAGSICPPPGIPGIPGIPPPGRRVAQGFAPAAPGAAAGALPPAGAAAGVLMEGGEVRSRASTGIGSVNKEDRPARITGKEGRTQVSRRAVGACTHAFESVGTRVHDTRGRRHSGLSPTPQNKKKVQRRRGPPAGPPFQGKPNNPRQDVSKSSLPASQPSICTRRTPPPKTKALTVLDEKTNRERKHRTQGQGSKARGVGGGDIQHSRLVQSTHPAAAHGLGSAEVLGPAEGFAAGVAVLLPPLSLLLPAMPSLACIIGSCTS